MRSRRHGFAWRSVLVAMVGLLLGSMAAVGVSPAEAQLFPASTPAVAPAEGAAAEFRGLWVDAFHDGIKTPEQVDRLLADARGANINALIVQVRRRGDG